MSSRRPPFDARVLSSKLRQVAFELRRAAANEPSAEHLARRLEGHAEAMLQPDGPRHPPSRYAPSG